MTEYAITDVVPHTGEYLCASCGEPTEFEAADDFAVCESCEDETASWAPLIEPDETVEKGEAQQEEEFASE